MQKQRATTSIWRRTFPNSSLCCKTNIFNHFNLVNLRDPLTNSTWWLYHIAYGGEVSLKQFKLQVLLHFHYMLLGIALPSLESIYTNCVCVSSLTITLWVMRPLPLNYYHLHITITPPPLSQKIGLNCLFCLKPSNLWKQKKVCVYCLHYFDVIGFYVLFTNVNLGN